MKPVSGKTYYHIQNEEEVMVTKVTKKYAHVQGVFWETKYLIKDFYKEHRASEVTAKKAYLNYKIEQCNINLNRQKELLTNYKKELKGLTNEKS